MALRAVATNADGTSYSTRNNVEVVDDASVDSVSIQTAGARYFLQPYADTDHASAMIPVSGVTTADSGHRGALHLAQRHRRVRRPDRGRRHAVRGRRSPARTSTQTFGRFTGLVELTAYDIEEGFVAVAAERDADDVAPIALTEQQITYVGASSDEQRPAGRAGRRQRSA